MDKAENQIRDLKYKEAKNSQWEQQEEKKIQKNEDCLRTLWDNFKHTNILIMAVPEGEESEQDIENLLGTNDRKRPLPGEGTRHTSPGRHTNSESAESSKQGEPKEAYTKTHHN